MPITAPPDSNLLDRLTALPPVGWLFIAGLIASVVRGIQLRIALANGPDESDARNKMTDLFIKLRQGTPNPGENVEFVRAAAAHAGLTLRDFDAGQADPRLLILHDDKPRRPIAAFPRLSHGRLVLFWTGRIVLASESAFEKLIEADDALRDRLGENPQRDKQGG